MSQIDIDVPHPAVRGAQKAAEEPDNETTEEILRSLDRSELIFALAAVSGAFDANETRLDPDDSGNVTKEELVALVQYAGRVEGDE